MTSPSFPPAAPEVDAVLGAANVLLRIAARSVLDVEEIVSTPQLRVLILIAGSGPQNLGEVAAELGVHPSNATRTCDRLVRSGLIRRSEDETDRRYIQLALTPMGADLVQHVLARRRSELSVILARMDAPDRDAVIGAFQVFADIAGVQGTSDGRFAFRLPA